MPPLTKNIFLLALALPVLCVLWKLLTYPHSYGVVDAVIIWLPELLVLVGILVLPGTLLFYAAHRSGRAWFAIGTSTLAFLFAALLCGLNLVKHGGFGIAAVAVIEALVGIVALLVALLLRLWQENGARARELAKRLVETKN